MTIVRGKSGVLYIVDGQSDGHAQLMSLTYIEEPIMSDQQQQNPQPEQNPQPQQQPDNPAPVEPAPVDQPATTQEQQDTEA